jgi:hypothetical protein
VHKNEKKAKKKDEREYFDLATLPLSNLTVMYFEMNKKWCTQNIKNKIFVVHERRDGFKKT